MDAVDVKVPIFHVAVCASCGHEHVCLEVLGTMTCGDCDRDEDCGRIDRCTSTTD